MENMNQGGEDFNSWIQPTCACGWVGRQHFAYSDYQHTNAHQELIAHKRNCKGVAEEPPKTEW